MASASSGDLLADRRYAYAVSCLQDKDAAAAADLFRQTLELVPHWAPAHFGLAEALELAQDNAAAIFAYTRAIQLAPQDELGAGVRLARLGAAPISAAMSAGYVAALFDEYAERFDTHLVQKLSYNGPQIILNALAQVCRVTGRDLSYALALDLGCGTGLMARAMAGLVGFMDGVDLSPAMVAKASSHQLYRAVWVGDAVAALSAPVDLILAADVLVYMGDLAPLFGAAARVLNRQGHFAFTVQSCSGNEFILGHDLRHHHSEAYLRREANCAGLSILHMQPCVTRQDAGQPVAGLVVVLAHAA